MFTNDPAHFLLMLCPQMIELLAMVQPKIGQFTSMLGGHKVYCTVMSVVHHKLCLFM